MSGPCTCCHRYRLGSVVLSVVRPQSRIRRRHDQWAECGVRLALEGHGNFTLHISRADCDMSRVGRDTYLRLLLAAWATEAWKGLGHWRRLGPLHRLLLEPGFACVVTYYSRTREVELSSSNQCPSFFAICNIGIDESNDATPFCV